MLDTKVINLIRINIHCTAPVIKYLKLSKTLIEFYAMAPFTIPIIHLGKWKWIIDIDINKSVVYFSILKKLKFWWMLLFQAAHINLLNYLFVA